MSQRAYLLTAAVIFSLITVGHLVRLGLNVEWIVAGRVMPMWGSVVGVVIAGFMAYEGFRLSRKA